MNKNHSCWPTFAAASLLILLALIPSTARCQSLTDPVRQPDGTVTLKIDGAPYVAAPVARWQSALNFQVRFELAEQKLQEQAEQLERYRRYVAVDEQSDALMQQKLQLYEKQLADYSRLVADIGRRQQQTGFLNSRAVRLLRDVGLPVVTIWLAARR